MFLFLLFTFFREEYDGSLALAPPIFTASTYKTPSDYVLGEPGRFVYGRYGNPSRNGAEAVIAELEGAKYCMLFSAGKVMHTFPEVYNSKQLERNLDPLRLS